MVTVLNSVFAIPEVKKPRRMKKVTQGRGGISCHYRGCGNTFYRKRNNDISFYRFPKDDLRCRSWLILSGRHDVIEDASFSSIHFNKTYRICSEHFEKTMFNNPNEKSRLLPSAAPRPFSSHAKKLYAHILRNYPRADDNIRGVPNILRPRVPPLPRINENCRSSKTATATVPVAVRKKITVKKILLPRVNANCQRENGNVKNVSGQNDEAMEIGTVDESPNYMFLQNVLFHDQECETIEIHVVDDPLDNTDDDALDQSEIIKVEVVDEPFGSTLTHSEVQHNSCEVDEQIKIEKIDDPFDYLETDQYKVCQLDKSIKIEPEDNTHHYPNKLGTACEDQDKLCKLDEHVKVEVKKEPLDIQYGSSNTVELGELSKLFTVEVKSEPVEYLPSDLNINYLINTDNSCEMVETEIKDEPSDYQFD